MSSTQLHGNDRKPPRRREENNEQEQKLREAVEYYLKKTAKGTALEVECRKADAAINAAKRQLCVAIKASGKCSVRYGRHQFSVGRKGEEADALVWDQFQGVMLGPETAAEQPGFPVAIAEGIAKGRPMESCDSDATGKEK